MNEADAIARLSSYPRADASANLRQNARFALLIRSAKLICDAGEFLCVVRDVSENGVKLRLFHPVPEGGSRQLELASGERFDVELMWHKDELAGLRFRNPVDITRFIAEAGPFPKRSLRIRLNAAAIVKADGLALPAMIRDISCDGLGIEMDHPLALEQRVTLEAADFPARAATVRWRRSPVYGIALEHILSFEALARIAARMQLPAAMLELAEREFSNLRRA